MIPIKTEDLPAFRMFSFLIIVKLGGTHWHKITHRIRTALVFIYYSWVCHLMAGRSEVEFQLLEGKKSISGCLYLSPCVNVAHWP